MKHCSSLPLTSPLSLQFIYKTSPGHSGSLKFGKQHWFNLFKLNLAPYNFSKHFLSGLGLFLLAPALHPPLLPGAVPHPLHQHLYSLQTSLKIHLLPRHVHPWTQEEIPEDQEDKQIITHVQSGVLLLLGTFSHLQHWAGCCGYFTGQTQHLCPFPICS